MRVACIGGGPASLYASLLFRQALPETEITVYERNREGDTFGWGVVFSDETLGHFERSDKPSYDAITAAFVHWTDIDTWLPRPGPRGTWVRSTGHGFSGMGRKRLLAILGQRCRDLGVKLVFEREVPDPRVLMREADLVLGADGVQSLVRSTFEAAFRPEIRLGNARFTWLGTTLPLTAFTFLFQETEHGLFTVHAYPFEQGLSTFIVECSEATWKRAGMDVADEPTTAAFMERVFAEHLKGHRLLINRSIWRRFPTIRCAAWHHENVVLLGDAVHTAHFSIGSGTKLAMEDAIALVDAFKAHGPGDVPGALATYETSRRRDVEKLQRAAKVSQAWFEAPARYLGQDPYAFVFNLMTRSQRLTWGNLAKRDPALVEEVARRYALRHGTPRHGTPTSAQAAPAAPATPLPPPPPLFAPLTLRSLTLPNRVVVSPMCMYSAVEGVPQEWHLVHLGSRAVGGAGLVMGEATGVSAQGRITPGCTGLWNDAQEAAWARIVAFVHRESASKIGLQIAHAGRKASCALPWEGGKALCGTAAWPTLGPTDQPFYPGDPAPRAMTRADMEQVREQFVASARRAARAGFDVLEIHAAHGYLLSSWLSAASNTRTDEHGGSLENRLRYPREVVAAVRAAWPDERPLFVRISASDWLEEGRGMTLDDAVQASRAFAALGVDVIDVSSAGNVPESPVEYGRMYQVPFADRIRHEAGVKVMAVGGVPDADHANTVLAAERADLVAIARGHLTDPYLTLRAAAAARHAPFAWPKQYGPAKPF